MSSAFQSLTLGFTQISFPGSALGQINLAGDKVFSILKTSSGIAIGGAFLGNGAVCRTDTDVLEHLLSP